MDAERVLVLGATGRTGQRAVWALLARGVAVRALVRDPARAEALLPPEVELRAGSPLDAGVRVVVAHCASLGHAEELDAKVRSGQPSNFELFTRLMDEPRWRANLFGDISAVVQANRVDVIPTLLTRRDWQARLLNGSDYPLPGVVPLIDLHGLVSRGLLDAALLDPLRMLRQHNVLLFDFVLKRSLGLQGHRFAPQVFETAPFFARL